MRIVQSLPVGRILSEIRRADGDTESIETILQTHRASAGMINAAVRLRVSSSWIRRHPWAALQESPSSPWRGIAPKNRP